MSSDIYLHPSQGKKPFSFYYKQATTVTGNPRLAQKFLKCLLTPAGTSLDSVVYGTALPDLIGGGVSDESHVRTVVDLAVNDAVRQVTQASVLGEVTLKTANVTNVVFDEHMNVDVYLTLVATDDSTIELTVPIDSGGVRQNYRQEVTLGTLLEGL